MCPGSPLGSWPGRCVGLSSRVTAVEHACCAKRGAVNGLAQLRLDDIGSSTVNRQTGEEQERGDEDRHVDKGEALVRDECAV